MADHSELMEAALDSYPEGIALVDCEGTVVFWNRVAETISGFPRMEVIGRPVPWAVEPLLDLADAPAPALQPSERGLLVRVQHKLGAGMAAFVRTRTLRDGLGIRIGSVVAFRAAGHGDALPRGVVSLGSEVEDSQARLEDRVEQVYAEFQQNGAHFGLLWIAVDQAGELRRTHGVRACESMLDRMERTLANGIDNAEEIGRWGDDEFLVLARQNAAGALAAHARTLTGLARTTDFRWWGDRISLTVSIGAAQASSGETLVQLLERVQAALFSSMHAGGNHITLAPGRTACSPS
ncbi:MAG TPA: diguanylate cyclase [Terracidiphilus sp.]|nr:diguanylate cyclase [Terracidiphilus sp.]